MNPYPRSHPLVRGGFSPLQTGNWTPHSGMAGLGDDSTDSVTPGTYASGYTDPFAPTGSNTNPSGVQLIADTPFSLSSIPSSVWMLLAGVAAFAFLYPSNTSRG